MRETEIQQRSLAGLNGWCFLKEKKVHTYYWPVYYYCHYYYSVHKLFSVTFLLKRTLTTWSHVIFKYKHFTKGMKFKKSSQNSIFHLCLGMIDLKEKREDNTLWKYLLLFHPFLVFLFVDVDHRASLCVFCQSDCNLGRCKQSLFSTHWELFCLWAFKLLNYFTNEIEIENSRFESPDMEMC